MMNRWLLSLCLSCVSLSLFATPDTTISDIDSTNFIKYEAEMSALLKTILRDTSQTNRLNASAGLETLLKEVLVQDGAYEYDFSRVEGMSILQPKDNAFRIFTWQLYVDKEDYQYSGFLQMPDGTIHHLVDKSDGMRQPEYDVLSPKKWYGALYYNIYPFKAENGEIMYMLFGYDAHSFFNRRKVLDVLRFDDKTGYPKFGAGVFEMNRPFPIQRFYVEYSAAVAVKMNYDEAKGMVIYDNLEAQRTSTGMQNIPNGSYEGFELKNGKWVHVDEVFTENPFYGIDNPPMVEKPVLDAEKKERKNIFGGKPRKIKHPRLDLD